MASRRLAAYAFVLFLIVPVARPARAQVGTTTGAIVGTVVDNTKAVIPGVTITVSGPALMGTRTVVTEAEGGYRIPAIPPGVYTLVFELSGFATIRREGVQVGLGFTATINVEMSPATLSENVTVSGASPVVDLASTKVTTSYGAEKLGNLAGSRDYAAITSFLPAVAMSRPSVGGSGAITYQRSTRYGLMGQDRGEVEGIVTTEAAAGGQEVGYSDSDSFEEMAVNVVGNNAEMPNPGTFTVVISKSGGNTYRGHVYGDYQNGGLQAHNIDAGQVSLGVKGAGTVATVDLNRMVEFRDLGTDLGGFVIKDKLWWYGAYRRQVLAQRYVNLTEDVQESKLIVYTGKVTYNLSQNNKLIGYYSHGTKYQNNSLMTADTQLVTADALRKQRWPNGPWKVEYNAIVGNSAVYEIRAGNFFEKGFYDGKGASTRYRDIGANWLRGTSTTSRHVHQRPQVNGSLTYIKDGWAGTHNFKFGGEGMRETWQNTDSVFNNRVLILNNGVPSQVELYLPSVKSLSALWAFGAYAQDTWKLNSRLTFNLGLRLDHFRPYVPAQAGPNGRQFDRIDAPLWTTPAPRIGIVYALTEDGKTLVKANYGQYWDFPYNSISGPINPNPPSSYSLYTWTPANPAYANGLPVYEPGQEGRLLSVTGARADGKPSTTVDPSIQNAYSRQALAFVEREVAANFGVRSGFVWNGRRQGYGTVNASTPYDAFNVPVTVRDPGPDGRLNTADDGGTLQAFNLDPAYLGRTPEQVLRNLSHQASDYYTWEITANRRQTGRWSLMGSFSETWSRAAPIPSGSSNTLLYTPNSLINTADRRNVFTTWTAKMSATLDVKGGVRVTPMIRHQSGTPFARTFRAALNFNSSVLIMAEPVGTERTASINIFDLRTEKIISVEGGTLGVFFDVYNILNTNAEQVVTTSSGSAFLRPDVITPPRIARIGLKFDF